MLNVASLREGPEQGRVTREYGSYGSNNEEGLTGEESTVAIASISRIRNANCSIVLDKPDKNETLQPCHCHNPFFPLLGFRQHPNENGSYSSVVNKQ